jgi:hypothetical protein
MVFFLGLLMLKAPAFSRRDEMEEGPLSSTSLDAKRSSSLLAPINE